MPSNTHCLLSYLFSLFWIRKCWTVFCCLQFGGMFLGPMMLLMDLTLPWENVLCLTFDCVKQYYMLSILYCITKKFYCTFTVDPLPLFFLFVLSSIYSKLLCPLKIYICLDINWMLIYYLIKCIVKSQSCCWIFYCNSQPWW